MKTLLSLAAVLGVLAFGAENASAASPAYCDGYAKHYADQHAGGNAVGGGIIGAIGGAALGGILGGGKGAGTGAIVGGVGGAVVGGSSWRKFYDQAYYQCVNSGPGYVVRPQPAYVVQPPVIVLPPVGSPAWNYRCSQKYRSFVATGPGTPGYYTGFDYAQHDCALP
jgi:hypothetical protein